MVFHKVLDAKSIKGPSSCLIVRTVSSDGVGNTQSSDNAFLHHEALGEAKSREPSCEPSLEETGRENIKVKEQSTGSQLMKIKDIC